MERALAAAAGDQVADGQVGYAVADCDDMAGQAVAEGGVLLARLPGQEQVMHDSRGADQGPALV